MDDIRNIRLELLRTGPAHNQLLSPLTTYLALSGDDGAVSVNLPFEHAQLLSRLDRLRYEIDGTTVAGSQRRAELQEMGDAIALVLGRVPGLVTELRSARLQTNRLVNIRLVISALELSMIPFEATMEPAELSGFGAPLLLRTPTSLTREIRRGQPLDVNWNRPPKILFAFASPPGLAPVPAQEHLEALRRAIAPWVCIDDSRKKRIESVQKMLTVLKDTTVHSISEACQAADYTHVHILAHGAPMPGTDGRRFGVALCNGKDANPEEYAVVDGQSLAISLKGLNATGNPRRAPTVVTLATCDSGNVGSVFTPGGSIAHELHAHDIPWVIASQFPLWMRASTVATEVLYHGLLSGQDPRWVLHNLRRRLRADFPETHDWASIVAYAVIPPDLEAQVDAFRSRQTKARMEVLFDRLDDLVGAKDGGLNQLDSATAPKVKSELEKLCSAIRSAMATWCDEPAARHKPSEQAERLGMRAASEKRIAVCYTPVDDGTKSREAYGKARDFYTEALRIEPANHWVLTQFLSVIATPALAPPGADLAALRAKYGSSWLVARQIAEWQARSASMTERAWAHGTLAELDLLGFVYGEGEFDTASVKASIEDHCREIVDLTKPNSFPVFSTRRQFRRYVEVWRRNEWTALAQAAVKALGGGQAKGV